MIFAIIIMLLSVVVVFVVKSDEARLGLISVFTIVFAVGVHITTSARRIALVASTAA